MRKRTAGGMPRRILLAGAILAGASTASAAGAEPPAAPRLASVSLCGDAWLLALAGRDQIASVSWQATGELSFHAEAARGLPQNRGTAEEMLEAGVDAVLLETGAEPQLRTVLPRFGIRVVDLPMAEDFPAIAAATRTIAAAIGRQTAGEAVVAEMAAGLAALAAGVPADPAARPVIAYYRPDGGGASVGTFVHAAIEAAGFRNLQALEGQVGWATLPVETLALNPPDLFAVSFFDDRRWSAARVLRRNPILWDTAAARPVVAVPGALWVCAHPLVAVAAARLAAGHALLAGNPAPGAWP